MSWALRRFSTSGASSTSTLSSKASKRLSLEMATGGDLPSEFLSSSPPVSPMASSPTSSRPHSPNNRAPSPRVSQIIEEEPDGKNMRRTDKLRRLSSVLTRLQGRSSRSHSIISIEPPKIVAMVAKFEPIDEDAPVGCFVEVEEVRTLPGVRQPRRHSKVEQVDLSIFAQNEKEEEPQHMTDKMAQAQKTLALTASSSEVKSSTSTRELATSDVESEEESDEDMDFEDFQPNWVMSSMDRIAQEEKRQFEAKYEVMQPLGSGNFSTVYAAKRRSDGKVFAVKKIDKTVLAGKEELIRAEIEIHTALEHPNITKVEDVYETHTEWNIVMQLADKGELFNYLCDNGALGERLSKDVARRLLKAVSFIHKRNVIHRDLKPENILLTGDEPFSNILVADFGLSTMIKPGEVLTKQCGSFEYAAPEVLSGSGYGLKADMWSVGVILYTMLCGYQPFQDEDDSHQLRLILSGKFAFHKTYWCFISEEAKDLVKKLLVVDPKQRLSAQEALKHPWFN